MALVEMNNVSISFPILHVSHRSLKKAIVATATGGVIQREAKSAPVVQALTAISGVFKPGDRVALIGPNGSGKTTLLRAIGGIYEPSSGTLRTEGSVMTLLDLSLGFNYDMTGRENIRLRGMYLGLKPEQIRELSPQIEAFTELGDYLDMPIRTYSSGMQLRLSFAVATSIQPDILLMDEWVLAGDASFVKKAQARMEQFVTGSRILVLASHSDAILRQWCNKAMFLISGHLVSYGEVGAVLDAYEEFRNRAA